MGYGEQVIMNVVIMLFIFLVGTAIRFLYRRIKDALHGLRKRSSVPTQTEPKPAPKPVTPVPEKEETVRIPVAGGTSSREMPPEGTVPLEPRKTPPARPPRYSPYRLRALSGEHRGKTFPLYEMEEFTIGRNPQCVIRFRPDTQGVSGLHCKVEMECYSGIGTSQIEVRLTDLNSTYGTYLGNGTRLTPNREYQLRAGDAFLLAKGGPAFLLEANETPYAPENDGPENGYPHTGW